MQNLEDFYVGCFPVIPETLGIIFNNMKLVAIMKDGNSLPLENPIRVTTKKVNDELIQIIPANKSFQKDGYNEFLLTVAGRHRVVGLLTICKVLNINPCERN